MTSPENTLNLSERFRLGRLILDGGSFEWLAEHTGRPVSDIAASWEYCREQLSQHFARVDGVEFRCYTLEELQERNMDALRLLLDWRQAVIDEQRTQAFLHQPDDDTESGKTD